MKHKPRSSGPGTAVEVTSRCICGNVWPCILAYGPDSIPREMVLGDLYAYNVFVGWRYCHPYATFPPGWAPL